MLYLFSTFSNKLKEGIKKEKGAKKTAPFF